MTDDQRDPWLLTPGPLTTSSSVKRAMLHDWGSRDGTFTRMSLEVREQLLAIVRASETHECVPIQGSGTFAIEATLGTLVAPSDKALVLVNGAYGHRMVKILERHGRAVQVLETPENVPVDPHALDTTLASAPDITHVVFVHCETTSGILNPLEAVARVTQTHGRRLIIDAMSAFGALEIDATAIRFDAVVASSNKCLEGVPGLGFALIRRASLEASAGHAPALTLNLHDQWKAMESNGQWRFTPPTHVLAALHQALAEHQGEGGVEGRGARYRHNHRLLVDGMRALGFETLLPDELQAPIIVTFHMPADPRFDFQAFYDRLAACGFVIYPGKLTVADSFRIGCIGSLGESQMRAALDAIASTLQAMGIHTCGRAA